MERNRKSLAREHINTHQSFLEVQEISSLFISSRKAKKKLAPGKSQSIERYNVNSHALKNLIKSAEESFPFLNKSSSSLESEATTKGLSRRFVLTTGLVHFCPGFSFRFLDLVDFFAR